jgi:hypothetical protein
MTDECVCPDLTWLMELEMDEDEEASGSPVPTAAGIRWDDDEEWDKDEEAGSEWLELRGAADAEDAVVSLPTPTVRRRMRRKRRTSHEADDKKTETLPTITHVDRCDPKRSTGSDVRTMRLVTSASSTASPAVAHRDPTRTRRRSTRGESGTGR